MERSRWSDERLDDKFSALERRINSLPDRVTVMETNLKGVAEDVRETRFEVKSLHQDLTNSKSGLTRGERIALLGSLGGFLGAVAAFVAVLSGAGG